MEIWEERYTNKNGKKESAKVFSMFQKYLEQKERPRSLKKLTADIYFKGKLSQKVLQSPYFTKKYNSILKNSTRYQWRDRANAHDAYMIKQSDEALIQKVAQFRLQEFENATKRVDGHNKTYKSLKRNTTERIVVKDQLIQREIREKEKVSSEKENQEAYSLALDDVFKIVHGGIVLTQNSNTNENHTEVKVEEVKSLKERELENESYFRELDRAMAETKSPLQDNDN